MKKYFSLILGLILIVSASSCKKKDDANVCDTWGVGTWKLTDIVDENDQSVIQDPNDPEWNCLLNSFEIKLNESQEGDYMKVGEYIDPDCETDTYDVISWADNLKTKKLYITIGFPDDKYTLYCIYKNENKFYWDSEGDGSLFGVFEKQ